MTEPWRLDVEGIIAEHQPNEDDELCRVCSQPYPCGAVWAADRVAEMRKRRQTKASASTGAGGSHDPEGQHDAD
jgi:hypothetical protein